MGMNTTEDEEEKMLLQQLSRGIEDMEDGRELPIDEAFNKITELRDARKRQEHDVFLTWEAIYDITDIAEYIEIYFGIEKADCFQQEIREIISDLNIFSLSGVKTYIQYRG